MPDYQKSKIYTLRNTDYPDKIYVGSTTQPLCKRLAEHKHYTCIPIEYPSSKWSIELYEEFPCDNREQLLKKEGEIIRLIGNLNYRKNEGLYKSRK